MIRCTPAAAIADLALLGGSFSGSSWDTWRAILKAAYAEPLADAELALFRSVAGDRAPPSRQVRELWVIAGRRSGKDSIASAIATVAAFGDYSAYLRPGERGVVMCLAVNRDQARIVHRYIAAYFTSVPLLAPLVIRETDEGVELTNGVDIVVATNSYRAVRGRTIVCPIFDESAFWRDETSSNPDVETYNAVVPGMATIPTAMLIGITTAYKKAGLAYAKWHKHFGKDDDAILVVYGATPQFNPTISQRLIDDAIARDPEAASAEWLSQWRSDISDFLDRELVEAAIDAGVVVRPPAPGITYVAFTDPSGGRGDSFTLGIAHAEGGTALLDLIYEKRAPFDPSVVVGEIADVLRGYGVAEVTGDRYAAGWVTEGFARAGISYKQSERDRSAVYLDALPVFTAGRARLLDNQRLVYQLVSLERRVMRGGRDRVDHPPAGADDLANSAAGALVLAASDAVPALWRADALLQDGSAVPWPAAAIGIFATCAADENGLFWALWARDGQLGGSPLALIDFGREAFSTELIVSLAKRVVAEANASFAPHRLIYAPSALSTEMVAVLTAHAVNMLATHANYARRREFDVVVRSTDVDDLLRDRDGLLLTGASAVGGGRVKMTVPAAERSKTLPSPLAGLRPGAPPGGATDAALIALGIMFATPPQKPIVRSSAR